MTWKHTQQEMQSSFSLTHSFWNLFACFSDFHKNNRNCYETFQKEQKRPLKKTFLFFDSEWERTSPSFCDCFQGVFRSSMFSRFCVFLIWKQKKHTLCKQRSGFCEITFFFFCFCFCVFFFESAFFLWFCLCLSFVLFSLSHPVCVCVCLEDV